MSRIEQEEHPSVPVAVRKSVVVAPAFYRIADVLSITALSRATLYRRIADGKFPQPVHLGGRACGWTPAALQAWIDDPQGYTAARSFRASANRASVQES